MTFPPVATISHSPQFSAYAPVTPRFGRENARETLPEDFLSSLPPPDTAYFDNKPKRHPKPSQQNGHASGFSGILGKAGAALWTGLKSALKWGLYTTPLLPLSIPMWLLGLIPLVGIPFHALALGMTLMPILAGSIAGTSAALKAFRQ